MCVLYVSVNNISCDYTCTCTYVCILFSSLVHLHDRTEHSLLIESVFAYNYMYSLHDHMLNYACQYLSPIYRDLEYMYMCMCVQMG